MALIKPILGEMAGSIAGVTFSHTKGGLSVKRRPTPTNPQTAAQQLVRANLDELARQWRDILTDIERQDWNAFAAIKTERNKLGESVNWSGQQQFIALNSRLLRIGGTVRTTSPPISGPPDLTSVTLTAGVGASASVAFTATPLDAGNKLVVWGLPNHSPGRQPLLSNCVILGVSAAAAVSPFALAAAPEPIDGLQYTVYAQVVDPYGQASVPVRATALGAL